MRVRLSKRADAQIISALTYVAAQSPQGAANIGRRLDVLLTVLAGSPSLGKITDESGVRRIPVSPYPYLIDYLVQEDEIVVLRFRHVAMRR